MAIILDLAIVAILFLFAWRGAARGLVLTLCSLLAVVVAFGGAFWISDQFSQPVSNLIQPYIQIHVENLLNGSVQQIQNQAPTPSFQVSLPSDGKDQSQQVGFSLTEVLDALHTSKLFTGLLQSVSDAINSGTLTVVTTATAAVSSFLAVQIARSGLFLLSFLFLLIAWWLFSHALDLAFHLPALRTLNQTGGILLGLVKGFLVLLIACWAIRTFQFIPDGITRQTFLFHYLMDIQVF